MASTNKNHGDHYWGYLINPDKSATTRLTQLCEALAKIICQLEPGPDTSLTPQRLSAFYRSVGGNDFVFRELRYPGLSLMYKTLGCFHSLQPTGNAFDPPSVPCLLVPGFVRWQTVQLLLQPNEHAKCMQKAVELYDVRAPEGGLFPKTIPRTAFPSKPDEAMEKWHNAVLERLDEGPKKLKNSPYCSPYDPVGTDREGYFSRGSNRFRRTSRPPRTELQDPPSRVSPSSHRRSSASNLPSPGEPPEALDVNYHWASDQAFSAPNSTIPRSPKPRTSGLQRSPSSSHHRTSHSHSHSHRVNSPNTTTNENTSKSFNLHFENLHIPFISSPFSSKKDKKRRSVSPAPTSSRNRSSRPYQAVSSGSEASSEDSLPGFSQFDRERRRVSLAPPKTYHRSQRRHSHDASYQQRPLYSPAFPAGAPQPSPRFHSMSPHGPTAVPHPSMIRGDVFNNGRHSTASPPEIPDGPQNPTVRVVDPAGRDESVDRGRLYHPHSTGSTLQERRAASLGKRSGSSDRRYAGHEARHPENAEGNHKDWERESMMRKQGKPLRINTVGGGGSNSRRVRTSDIRSAGLPSLRRVPPMGLSGGGRR